MRQLVSVPRCGLVVILMMLAGCGASATSENADPSQSRQEATYTANTVAEVWDMGVFTTTTKISFPDRRRVVKVGLQLPKRAHPTAVPLRGRPLSRVALPTVVKARSELTVLAVYAPECPGSESVPRLVAETVDDAGKKRVETFGSPYSEKFRTVVQKYCKQGPTARVMGSRQNPDGTFSVTLRVFDPGQDPVEVVSEAYENEGTRWFRASKTIPPVEGGELTIRGEGEGCSPVTPWSTGHLTIDGKPVSLRQGSNEQC